MASIKSKNTFLEIAIRKRLHAKGLRYRLHLKGLPGRPDIVFPKFKAVVFINGCFWHQHGCYLSVMPKTRSDWWKRKLTGNQKRDLLNYELLRAQGWRIAIVWECSVKGLRKVKKEKKLDEIANKLMSFLLSGRKYISLGHKRIPVG